MFGFQQKGQAYNAWKKKKNKKLPKDKVIIIAKVRYDKDVKCQT